MTDADHTADRHAPATQPSTIAAPGTFSDDLAVAVRARRARLRRLWQMTPAQRVAAMRRGELTYEQLAAWSARYPDQIPILQGEYLWLIAHTPEVCE